MTNEQAYRLIKSNFEANFGRRLTKKEVDAILMTTIQGFEKGAFRIIER